MFETTVDRLTDLGDALAETVAGLAPDATTAESADRAWEALDRLERLASAGKVVLAHRATQAPPPQSGPGAGAKSPAESLAARAGTSLGAAREALETSRRLAESTALDRAVREGALSAPQAAAVASAVAADPQEADRLIAYARGTSLAELRDECARVRAAADPDPAARNARLHRARRLRRFTDSEGAWQLLARGTPQSGSAFNAVLDPLIDQIFQTARRSGRSEPIEAYAFDALMALADLAAGEQPDSLWAGHPSGEHADRDAAASDIGGEREVDQDTARVPHGCRVAGQPSSRADAEQSSSRADAEQSSSRGAAESRRGWGPREASTRRGSESPKDRRFEEPTSRRLEELPWWAAAQGLLLGDESDRPEDSDPTSAHGRLPEWWRAAHLLDPVQPAAGIVTEPREGVLLREGHEDALGRADAGDGPRGRPTTQAGEPPGLPSLAIGEPPGLPSSAFGEPPGLPGSAVGEPPGRSGPEVDESPQRPRPTSGRASPVGRSRASPPRSPGHRNPRHLALLRVDLEALRRGAVDPGETCEIAGVGPVPVEIARELLGDAVLKLVITRGVDVLNVTHLGRGPTAAQRVALAWQSPGCNVLGCPRRRVEIDHREDWARTHHTRLDELDPLCGHHHDLKTRRGWALVAGTGRRAFVSPTDPRHPGHHEAGAADCHTRTPPQRPAA